MKDIYFYNYFLVIHCQWFRKIEFQSIIQHPLGYGTTYIGLEESTEIESYSHIVNKLKITQTLFNLWRKLAHFNINKDDLPWYFRFDKKIHVHLDFSDELQDVLLGEDLDGVVCLPTGGHLCQISALRFWINDDDKGQHFDQQKVYVKKGFDGFIFPLVVTSLTFVTIRISGRYSPFILAPPGGFGGPSAHSQHNLPSWIIMICYF